MNNYITTQQVMKGGWAVLILVLGVAGYSFKIFAGHSSEISSLRASVTSEIESRKANEMTMREIRLDLRDLNLRSAERDGDTKYLKQMVEKLLEKQRIPLPDKPIIE